MRNLLAIQAGKVSCFFYGMSQRHGSTEIEPGIYDHRLFTPLADVFYNLAFRLNGDGAIRGLYGS